MAKDIDIDKLLEDNRSEVDIINARMLWTVSLAATIIFAVFEIISLAIPEWHFALLPYGTAGAISAICFMISQVWFRVHPDQVLLPTYVYCICLFVIAVYMRVAVLPFGSMVAYVMLMLVLPVLIIDKSMRLDIIMGLVTIFFCMYTIKANPIYAFSDSVNAIIVLAVAIIVGRYMCKNRLIAIDSGRLERFQRDTDLATMLPNRRMLFEKLDAHTDKVAGIMLIQIDFFKEYNERYGRKKGDQCLKRIGASFSDFGYNHDAQIYRYGSDEFLALVNTGTRDELANTADELVKLISGLDIENDVSDFDKITATVGYVSSDDGTFNNYVDMITMTDKALFVARRDGRNRAVGYADVKDQDVSVRPSARLSAATRDAGSTAETDAAAGADAADAATGADATNAGSAGADATDAEGPARK